MGRHSGGKHVELHEVQVMWGGVRTAERLGAPPLAARHSAGVRVGVTHGSSCPAPPSTSCKRAQSIAILTTSPPPAHTVQVLT